jgi:hypothetical protein
MKIIVLGGGGILMQRVNHVLGFTLLRFFTNKEGSSILFFLLRRVFLPRW